MTPKEKAEELMSKYRFILSEIQLKYGLMLMRDVIIINKKLALIEVNEILNLGLGFMNDDKAWDLEKYYKEVEIEINNMYNKL